MFRRAKMLKPTAFRFNDTTAIECSSLRVTVFFMSTFIMSVVRRTFVGYFTSNWICDNQ